MTENILIINDIVTWCTQRCTRSSTVLAFCKSATGKTYHNTFFNLTYSPYMPKTANIKMECGVIALNVKKMGIFRIVIFYSFHIQKRHLRNDCYICRSMKKQPQSRGAH